MEAHGGSTVAVPAPLSDEGCGVFVLRIKRQAMVPVPSIEDCLFGLAWNGGYKIEWAGCVVDLPEGCLVNFLEVDSPSWFAVLFWCNNHSGAVLADRALRDRLYDAQSDIPI